jgi:hypothetical protein
MTIDPIDSTTRPAVEGERCTCGRPAVEVFITATHGEVGYCGLPDGGRRGPCVFCGSPEKHIGRCPEYRLRAVQEKQ